jgi:hypothetical protein
MDEYVYHELMSLIDSLERMAGENTDLLLAIDDARAAVRAEWREARRENTDEEAHL